MEERIEGYWRRTEGEDSELPWPVVDHAWPNQAFLRALENAEDRAGGMDYMGFSTCRLCGCTNGASEFELHGWVWPEGFKHYVADHNVRPTKEFEAFVLSSARDDALP